ncbi:MAG: malonyl-ACP O-methyltransferase BioC [Gammaproteobacteria bacterium]|nr:malonyl-ACP O-methyltransferase BioC [Gammaproteobacteria bacterium]MBU2057885.1 malonyl-ACP O-methyltransferase BioC [Gammaproteobacteria bacterium]MBU2176680.1 malonyl-ACP O-methyltransferase BioC [Gammaproteobacteria bacterium]MBU2247813.1 malonyl-ACP O-methyltransferase BioC [Gammaproteobacteria bacterium]MBU2395155.1 malonyl-ACP O-methyltransferase BioC [Gammaproteobacteria bacterium]
MNALALTDHIARHFGRARESYEQAARLQRLVAAQALSLLKPTDGLLLDLGSGPGWFHSKLKQHCTDLVALDLSFDMLQKAREAQDATLVVQADAQSLPLASASIDRVFSSLMLQWCEQPQLVLHEIARVIKPGGSAVISTLLDGTLQEFKQAWSEVDSHQHINQFLPLDFYHQLERQCPDLGLKLQTETVQLEYPDVLALARELKDLGANTVTQDRNKALTGKQRWQKVQQAYPSRCIDGSISASYQVLYLVLTKKNKE